MSDLNTKYDIPSNVETTNASAVGLSDWLNRAALPTPIYDEDGITLYNADCTRVLPLLEPMSADLVLTDPPYGLDWNYDLHNDTETILADLIKAVMPQILRVGKRTLLTCGHDNIWIYPKADWVLCWHIPAGAGQNRWGFTTWQPILAYGKDAYRENGMGARADSFSITETAEKNGHPCPKPIGVWEKVLLRGSVKTTDIILDPFAGSGTTLVAAKRLGRKAIGIEISEKYCRIAIDRLRQRELF